MVQKVFGIREAKNDKMMKRIQTVSPTPLQNSNDTFEEEQVLLGVEDQMLSAKDGTTVARTKQHLERSYSVKVEVEELEDLLRPDDADPARSKRWKRVREIRDRQHGWFE